MERFISNKKFKISIAIGLWILLWELLAYYINEEILLVSPLSVFQRILKECKNPNFWIILGNTGLHIIIGFFLGGIFGLFIAILSFYQSFLRFFFRPMVLAIQGTPVVSFIILILLWVPVSRLSIIISALIVFPIFYHNTLLGMENVTKDYLDMAKVFCWTERKKWKYLYLPSLKLFLGSAMCTGVGLAWKAGLAAEVIGLPKGTVGEKIYESKIFLDTEGLFAYTIVAVLLSFLMEGGLKKLWKPLKSNH
ncbi:MAG: ABC transporter permease subunit [Tissierellia bacterium]|nr:ABC transporter permease subunit [Tissierellia bacterium]